MMEIMSEVLRDSKFEMNSIISDGGQINYILSAEQREAASGILESIDFPTTRDEAWKYTRVAKIKNAQFGIRDSGTIDAVEKYLVPGLEGSRLVFVNGFYRADLSVIKEASGIYVAPLSDGRHQDWSKDYLGAILPLDGEIFHAMNTYYATDGVAVHIAKKTAAAESIQVIFIATGDHTFTAARNLIVCEDFGSAHIALGFFSENAEASFSNVVTEIFAGANSHLSIDKIQSEDASAYCISTEQVKQEKDATFTINTITLDGGLVRNNLNIAVDGQNAETNLSGAYILGGKQHVDNHTVVDHKVANCVSNELYKGVMDGQSTAVFNGKVFVRKDAQKINAFQSNGNVLLSDNATINSKPELEIYADDVKCSHGSTTGQLDEEAVFYLRARGLSEKSARALMVSAFIGDVLAKVENEHVRAFIDRILLEKFGWEF